MISRSTALLLQSWSIAALHCQPPIWTIWSELQRQIWLWGEYREYYEYSNTLLFVEKSTMITLTFTLFFGKWLPVQIFGIGWKLLEDTEFCFRCERVRSTAWTCRLGINLESWCQQYFEYFSHFLYCGHSFIQTSGLFGEPMLRIMGTPLILGIEAF